MSRVITFCVVFLTASALAVPTAFSAGESTQGDVSKWLTVQVQNDKGEQVQVQLPLVLRELIEKVVDFERLAELTEADAEAPLRIMGDILRELEASAPQEILTLEAEGATVKLATAVRERAEGTEPAAVLKISVKPRGGKGDKVNLAVPLGIVEMVAGCVKAGPLSEENFEAWGMGPQETGVRLAALVKELPEVIATIRGIGPVEILSVKGGNEDIRVWTE